MSHSEANYLCGAVKIVAEDVNPKFTVCHYQSCRAWGDAPFFADGNDFLPQCKVAVKIMDDGAENASYEDIISMISCLSTIHGAREMNSIYEKIDMPTLFCIPNNIQNGQLIRVAIQYMESNPSELHNSFVFLLRMAFNEAYPCSRI